jgi:hypothetical protein
MMISRANRGDRNRGRCARALLVVLLAVVLVSGIFIVTHAHHDCTGPGCHTCAEISICRLVIEGAGLVALLVVSGFIRVVAFGRRRADSSVEFGYIARKSLFSGGVRLNC